MARGEFCFWLHQPQLIKTRLEVPGTDQMETEQSGTGEAQGATVLDSVDPFPNLRRLSGPSRSLLKTYFEKNAPVELPKDHTTVAFS